MYTKGENMIKIKYWGERIAGYAPALPHNPIGCSEMLCPFLVHG